MNKVKGRYLLLATLVLATFTIASVIGFLYGPGIFVLPTVKIFNLSTEEHMGTEEYFTLVDEQGRVLDMMARRIYLNDEFIAADNWRYRVVRIKGHTAICRKLKLEQLSLSGDSVTAFTETHMPVQGKEKQTVGIYYTHDGECYVPTEGTENIPGDGGILRVGTIFAERLRSLGLNIADNKTSHAPHDDGAYRRSRRTAITLIKQGAAAIFDIHRDGVPDPNFYRQVINNENITKIRLVVGRQNQNMNSNLDYAKRIKAMADERYPGLIHGIFMGSGSYNQDLSPRAMLLEVGTHTNSRPEAERGVKYFADIVPPTLSAVMGSSAPQTASTSADWTSVLLILLAVAIGGGTYLVMATGSWDKAVNRLKEFATVELADVLGEPQKRKSFFVDKFGKKDKQDTDKVEEGNQDK